jgi:hypothetical protein
LGEHRRFAAKPSHRESHQRQPVGCKSVGRGGAALVRLIDTPTEAGVLAPLVTREIVYRLLMGKQGDRLRLIAVLGGYTSPIARAIERLRQDFDQPLRIDDVLREFGMSVSGFHHHFKAVTAMSPLQFQKQMRLQEARWLITSIFWGNMSLTSTKLTRWIICGRCASHPGKSKSLIALPYAREIFP